VRNQSLLIGNAQGFWGDRPHAAKTLLEQVPEIDFITFDYLAEVSLSILAIQKEKDPEAGYARDFLQVIEDLIPFWKAGSKVKLISNAGGLNPHACAKACKRLLQAHGCHEISLGVVDGDDVLQVLKESEASGYCNSETQKEIGAIQNELKTANAYLGAAPLVDALKLGASIIITGRVADPSLTVAACAYSFNWNFNDYKRLAAATIAGHLIECGTQVCGGISSNWLNIPNPASMGFPIIEMQASGEFIVTKPKDSGGTVNIHTVKEQLLYELGNPGAYLSPDATVSFLELELKEDGLNRIAVSGAKGSAPPDTYKVSATYFNGYKTEGSIIIYGDKCREKGKRCGKMVIERVQQAGFTLDEYLIETLGAGSVVPGFAEIDPPEIVLRIAARSSDKESLIYLAKEIAPLVTSGPQGTTGYSQGRSKIRPVFNYWPTLISRNSVTPHTTIVEDI